MCDKHPVKNTKQINFFKVTEIMSQLAVEFQAPIPDIDELNYETDTCVYVISRQAGEAGDRKLEKGDYYLLDSEYEQIKLCTKYYKNVVLIINSCPIIQIKPPTKNTFKYIHTADNIFTSFFNNFNQMRNSWY